MYHATEKKKENLSQIRSQPRSGEAKRANAEKRQRPGSGVLETEAMMDVRARRAPPNPPGSVNSNTVPRRCRAETAREKKKARNQGGSRLFVPFAKRVIRGRLPQLWSALRSNPVRPP
jgi:hypothetical protein